MIAEEPAQNKGCSIHPCNRAVTTRRGERAEFTFSVSPLLHTNRCPPCPDEYRYENLANISRAVGKNNKGDVETRVDSSARGVDMSRVSGGGVDERSASGWRCKQSHFMSAGVHGMA